MPVKYTQKVQPLIPTRVRVGKNNLQGEKVGASGLVTFLRIIGIIAEIGASIELPGVGAAVGIGLAGATYQEGIDLFTGEFSATSAIVNYGSVIIPGAAYIRQETKTLKTSVLFAENKFAGALGDEEGILKTLASGRPKKYQKEIRDLFKEKKFQRFFLEGQRRALRKALFPAYSKTFGTKVKDIKELLAEAGGWIEASNQLDATVLAAADLSVLDKTEDSLIRLAQLFGKKELDAVRKSIFKQRMKDLIERYPDIIKEKADTLYKEVYLPLLKSKRTWNTFLGGLKGRLGSDFSGLQKALVSDVYLEIQYTLNNAVKAAPGITKSEDLAGKNRTVESLALEQKANRVEFAKTEKEFGSWTTEDILEQSPSNPDLRKAIGRRTNIQARARANFLNREISSDSKFKRQLKEVIGSPKGTTEQIKKKGFLKFWGTEQGHFWTQKLQLGSANDVGREFTNTIYKLIRSKIPESRLAKFKSLYKLESLIEKELYKNIIPFVTSEWLLGVRAIKLDPKGLMNKLIVFHKDRNYPPVFVSQNVSKEKLFEFLEAPSPGAYYHKHFAYFSNGKNSIPGAVFSNVIAGVVPLGALRNLLSVTSNIIGVIKDAAAGKGFLSGEWWDDVGKTINRNYKNRLGRLIGQGVAGRIGGKFGTAAAKSIVDRKNAGKYFQESFTTSVRTGLLARSSKNYRAVISGRRYIQNLGRPLGQLNKIGKIGKK